MNADEELNRVSCRVTYEPTVTRLAVNEKIAEKLTTEAIKRIRSYGIKCTKEPISPRGGGFDTWWSAVQQLWEFRRYISIIIVSFKAIKYLVKYPFIRHLNSSRPTLTIFLASRKTTPYSDHDWHGPVSGKLNDLKFLAQDLSDYFSQSYPLYGFNQHIKLSISAHSFRVDIFQDHQAVSNFNNGRLLKHISRVDIKEKLAFSFRFAKFGLISQDVYPTTVQGSMWISSSKGKTYYTWLSTKLITRYPDDKPSVIGRLRFKLKIRTRVKSVLRKVRVLRRRPNKTLG